MRRDDLGDGEAEVRRDLGQILAVVGDGHLHHLRRSLRGAGPTRGTRAAIAAASRPSARRPGALRTISVRAAGITSAIPGSGCGGERVEERERRVEVGQLDQERARPDGKEAHRHACHSRSGTSVTNMCPGAWVMANGTREAITAACGVTPQAQNTGISPGSDVDRIAEVRPAEVGDAERLGRADMHRRAVHRRIAAGDRHRLGHPLGRDRAHRHHQRAGEPPGRAAGPVGAVHRHVAALRDVADLDARLHQRRLEGEASSRSGRRRDRDARPRPRSRR